MFIHNEKKLKIFITKDLIGTVQLKKKKMNS